MEMCVDLAMYLGIAISTSILPLSSKEPLAQDSDFGNDVYLFVISVVNFSPKQ